jgi:hypothetical protein
VQIKLTIVGYRLRLRCRQVYRTRGDDMASRRNALYIKAGIDTVSCGKCTTRLKELLRGHPSSGPRSARAKRQDRAMIAPSSRVAPPSGLESIPAINRCRRTAGRTAPRGPCEVRW